jgi:hypothetical protein
MYELSTGINLFYDENNKNNGEISIMYKIGNLTEIPQLSNDLSQNFSNFIKNCLTL